MKLKQVYIFSELSFFWRSGFRPSGGIFWQSVRRSKRSAEYVKTIVLKTYTLTSQLRPLMYSNILFSCDSAKVCANFQQELCILAQVPSPSLGDFTNLSDPLKSHFGALVSALVPSPFQTPLQQIIQKMAAHSLSKMQPQIYTCPVATEQLFVRNLWYTTITNKFQILKKPKALKNLRNSNLTVHFNFLWI